LDCGAEMLDKYCLKNYCLYLLLSENYCLKKISEKFSSPILVIILFDHAFIVS